VRDEEAATVDGARLQDTAQLRAESLPAVTYEQPFGPRWEVFKVHGRMFLLMTDLPGSPVVILKCDPDEAEALRHAYPDDISAGYHMNKRHWVTLTPGGSLDEQLVEELVTDSYRLVVGKLPRVLRPVDPETFGARAPGAR
jgi:predicted DNA-binding protein (MmcQ/YjbR family)